MDSNTTSGANASTGSRIRYLRHPTLLLTRAADEEWNFWSGSSRHPGAAVARKTRAIGRELFRTVMTYLMNIVRASNTDHWRAIVRPWRGDRCPKMARLRRKSKANQRRRGRRPLRHTDARSPSPRKSVCCLSASAYAAGLSPRRLETDRTPVKYREP